MINWDSSTADDKTYTIGQDPEHGESNDSCIDVKSGKAEAWKYGGCWTDVSPVMDDLVYLAEYAGILLPGCQMERLDL